MAERRCKCYELLASHFVLSTYFWRNIAIEDIKLALQTFCSFCFTNTGQTEIFQFKHFKFRLTLLTTQMDWNCFQDFVSKLDGETRYWYQRYRDRRDEDIRELGRISENILMRSSSADNLRGRTAEEIVNLLVEGLNETKPKGKYRLRSSTMKKKPSCMLTMQNRDRL